MLHARTKHALIDLVVTATGNSEIGFDESKSLPSRDLCKTQQNGNKACIRSFSQVAFSYRFPLPRGMTVGFAKVSVGRMIFKNRVVTSDLVIFVQVTR